VAQEESTLTVLVATAANGAIAVLKFVAGAFTGSAVMFAEAAHSVADTATELLLLTALRRSARRPDRRHPFGYGKERFFWALIAAVSIFVSGAVFAIIEGVRTILGDEVEQTLAWVAYAVLAVSFVLEGISWLQAVRQVRAAAHAESTTPLRWLRATDDPTVRSVFFEDSAALVGLLLAFGGVGLHQLTGSSFWDGLASLLVGRQADRATVLALRDALATRPEVDQVVDLLTMTIGTDQVLLCARLDFADAIGVAQLERACVDIDAELHERFPDLQEVFLEPVPRTDPVMRRRVMERYGPRVTDRLRGR
jgi:cation diffusion facilitator family transporter